jgi:type I restriction enzyme S subunit
MIINDLFNLGLRNSRLYSDLFYKYQDYQYKQGIDEKVAIYSSQAKILGYLPSSILKQHSVYSTKNAVIMYRKGRAGTLFIPFHNKWACSENAIPLLLKDDYKGKIDLNTLIILLQDQIYEKTTGKSDNANANWDMIKDMKLNFNYDAKVADEYRKVAKIILKCKDLKDAIERQLKKSVIVDGKPKKVSDIFNVTSGIRITENEVYYHKGDLPCITSQTTNNGITWNADEKWLESFKKNKKSVIIDSKCITWTKDGNAGKLFYRDYKFYPNDHCGVLLPKKDNINLKWFMHTYQQFIYPYVTSKNAQGMLYEEQMSNIPIIFPEDKSKQNEIAEEYEGLVNIKNKLDFFMIKLKKQAQVVVCPPK